ncbi:hypothetical protein ARMSODRAFT_1045604 [Armillaria solidipes]|uniref:F-box domain-containing protein n=1 Tax=Armillaria solidipes TaxID=1076256 RepID=A0A2H3BTB6_9AGAR|nr:hypothetical protein ARMSODRAFT_1045604 [Armillaria solidipes]
MSPGVRLDDLSSMKKLTVHVNRENIVFSLFHQLMCPRTPPGLCEQAITIPPNFVMYATTPVDVQIRLDWTIVHNDVTSQAGGGKEGMPAQGGQPLWGVALEAFDEFACLVDEIDGISISRFFLPFIPADGLYWDVTVGSIVEAEITAPMMFGEFTCTSYATICNTAYQADFVRSVAKVGIQVHLFPTISPKIHTSMSSLTCSNCGFFNPLSPESQLQTLNGSDNLVSQILRGSQPLLESDHAQINDEIAKLVRLRSWYPYNAQFQHAVLKSLENRKSVFAPVRRLPRDILLDIFHSVCDSWWVNVEEDEFQCDSLDMTGPLWVLGSVCGLWRDILRTSPASWARYILVTSPFSKHAREILQTYLKHTGEHPLSLVAVCRSPNFADYGEIMSLLIQSSYRWKNTIEMYICDDYGYPSDMSLDMCLKASQLWQATLPNQGIHRVRLPSGITHYSGCITCAEDLQLLSQLPKLRTCHLRSSETSLTDAAPVVMAELRQLYVEDSDALDLLTAPMLQNLTIVEVSEGSPSSSSIAPFLRRSGCRLESLASKTLITPTPNTTHTNPQVRGGF